MKPKDSRFWDRIAKKYARTPVADEAAYQKKLDITHGYFRPDMRVLEFGCGTGSTAIAHAPFVKHIHAIDISKDDIARISLDVVREPYRAIIVNHPAAHALVLPVGTIGKSRKSHFADAFRIADTPARLFVVVGISVILHSIALYMTFRTIRQQNQASIEPAQTSS